MAAAADVSLGARGRLPFLDGIRGAAALYVLIFHVLTAAAVVGADPSSLSLPMRALRLAFSQGHFAVCVFIVLSGFSLMLPLARRDRHELDGGMGRYLKRRARRILPPYYAALAISIAAIVIVSASAGTRGAPGRYDVALSPGSLTSHAVLLHNWNFDWAFRINGPMWSVATEWQIYFLFPLLLLPLWRRIGPWPTIALAWAAAMALDFFVPDDFNLYWAAPWFVGSFALGMAGAELVASDRLRATRLRAAPWGWLALALFAAVATIIVTDNADWPYPVVDLVVSLFAFALILACATSKSVGSAQVGRFFGWRPMVILGAFSYSIYLLQHPLLRMSEEILARTHLGYEAGLWVLLVGGVPILLGVSWGFAELFEFPFTTGSHVVPWLSRTMRLHPRSRRGRSVSTATIVD